MIGPVPFLLEEKMTDIVDVIYKLKDGRQRKGFCKRYLVSSEVVANVYGRIRKFKKDYIEHNYPEPMTVFYKEVEEAI